MRVADFGFIRVTRNPMGIAGSEVMAAQQNIRAAQQKFRAGRTWEGANYVAHHIAPTTVVIMRMGITAASTTVVIIQMGGYRYDISIGGSFRLLG